MKLFRSSLFKFAAILVVAGITTLLALTGCVSTPQVDPDTGAVTNTVTTLDVNTTKALITGMAEIGVYTAVQKDPSTAQYFQLANQVINGLADAGTFDPVAIENSLMALSKDLKDDQYAELGVKTALTFYKTIFASIISEKLDSTKYAKPILLALADGIKSGLEGAQGVDGNKFAKKYNLKR